MLSLTKGYDSCSCGTHHCHNCKSHWNTCTCKVWLEHRFYTPPQQIIDYLAVAEPSVQPTMEKINIWQIKSCLAAVTWAPVVLLTMNRFYIEIFRIFPSYTTAGSDAIRKILGCSRLFGIEDLQHGHPSLYAHHDYPNATGLYLQSSVYVMYHHD